jgi:DNA-binding GntR family transcriptional regulator
MSAVKPNEMADVLRRAIREGQLKPGQNLLQQELAQQFGVSRIPLREALRTLAAEGLVTLEMGIGGVVTRLDRDEIQELYELRLMLEPQLAPAIVAGCSQVDVRRLADAATEMERYSPDHKEAWATANFNFHRSMYEVTNRPHTVRLITQILNLVEPYSRLYVYGLDALGRVQHEHHGMVEAISSRDVAGLESMIRLHLEGARDGLLSRMERQSSAR